MTYQALTAYDVPIPRALTCREDVAAWIEEHGPKFPGARVVRVTKTGGKRTIWRHQEREAA